MQTAVDTSHIHLLLDQAYQNRSKDLAQSMQDTERALQESQALDYEAGIYKALEQLGLFNLIRCDFDAALDNTHEALQYYTRQQDEHGLALCHYNLGSVYYRQDKFHLGLIHLQQALRYFRLRDDYTNQARVLKSIGTIYEYFQDYDSARQVYEESIHAAQQCGDQNAESNAYNPLSGLYLKAGREAEAKAIIERSIALKEATQDIRGLAFSIYARAKLYLYQGRHEAALRDLQTALSMNESAADRLGMGMAYNKMGRVYLAMGNHRAARTAFRQAFDIGRTHNMKFFRYKAAWHLYQLAKEDGYSIEALGYLEEYVSAKESVINSETRHIIKSYEERSRLEALEHEARIQREKSEIIELKNAELDLFFYRVSHDLRGPISSMIGLDIIANMDVKDEKALSYFRMYNTQVNRINNIVLSLIELTQMKNLEVTKTRIDFERLVDECIQSYSYIEHFHRIRFIRDIQPGIEFYSEWAIINTIVQSLVENAIKYARTYGEPYVRIQVEAQDNYLTLVIEDNGSGIPEEYRNRIFDMFFRANDHVQGSGLGLYILRRAVERLHGTIDLHSELNQGSRFTVALPV